MKGYARSVKLMIPVLLLTVAEPISMTHKIVQNPMLEWFGLLKHQFIQQITIDKLHREQINCKWNAGIKKIPRQLMIYLEIRMLKSYGSRIVIIMH